MLGHPALFLGAQFTRHTGPRRMLLVTSAQLVEASPHDYFWGRGVDGSGANHLGMLLMRLRDELAAAGKRRPQPYTAPTGLPNGLGQAAAMPAPATPAARGSVSSARG